MSIDIVFLSASCVCVNVLTFFLAHLQCSCQSDEFLSTSEHTIDSSHTSTDIQLSVPRVRHSTFVTRGAFFVAGPTVWNSLPDHLRDPAVDSEQFRRGLEDVSVRRTFEALAY